MSGNELYFIQDALNKNWVTSQGENIDEFEQSISVFLKNDVNVCALNSATSAIHLSLLMLGISSNDEVLTSTFSFCGSANPIAYCGATPIFIDSEKDTWNMCPVALEEAIQDRISKGKKPKAIVVVHLYGICLLYTSPSPRDQRGSRMPSSA